MGYDPLSDVIDEPLYITPAVLARLAALRSRPRLPKLPGVDTTEERARLGALLDALIDHLLANVAQHPTKLWVLGQCQPALAAVAMEDTEAREHFGAEIEAIMDSVGIDSSDGLLSFYLGGM